MKVLVVLVLFGALAAAIPTPSDEVKSVEQPQNEQQKQDELLAADANPQGDNANNDENAERLKRFIFFSKILYPYPVAYQPVVTPVVTKTVAVAPPPPPVQYTVRVKPVTYQYTYSIPTYTVVKTAPIVKSVAVATVPAPAVTVTKTATVAEATAEVDEEE